MFPTIRNFDMWWKAESNRMENRIAQVGGGDAEFNSLQFEKKLSSLKDSQESINSCSAWCLENRKHHKKIVMAWLNVLKRVKVDHRLILFYLANDVIQYSKRKNYDFVESWSTTLQKATTMVREEKVKHKILRIFKIWEQRGVYSEEFISDLSGLISATPTKKDDISEFQSTYCIAKIKSCANLEKDTDAKLKLVKEHHPKSLDDLQPFTKDRSHVQDAENEVDDHIKRVEAYIKALQAEIKARAHLINVLSQAEKHYEVERKEVKVVVNAYRTFGSKVKAVKKKLDEMIPSLQSPVPSPDINAPSPGPDSDIELPGNDNGEETSDQIYNMNPGFYNQMNSNETNSFTTNGFSSFMSSNMSFNMQNFDTSSIFSNQSNVGYDPTTLFKAAPPPPPAVPPVPTPVPVPNAFDYGGNNTTPLAPPPLPPFTTSNYLESTNSYSNSTYANASYQRSVQSSYIPTSQETITYQRNPDEYNPEEEIETWDSTEPWEVPGPGLDTPESPPMFEKESFMEPIEYDETKLLSNRLDIDQRILPASLDLQIDGLDQNPRGNTDVDHRNLISLTGSPGLDSGTPTLPTSLWGTQGDQDYRTRSVDQDYRVPFNINHDSIPLPQTQTDNSRIISPNDKTQQQDNVESIDMELSDGEDSPTKSSSNIVQQHQQQSQQDFVHQYDENNIFGGPAPSSDDLLNNHSIQTVVGTLLEPPPPIPQNLCDFPDLDVDANNLLDNLDKEIASEDFLPDAIEAVEAASKFSLLGAAPPPPPATLLHAPDFGNAWSAEYGNAGVGEEQLQHQWTDDSSPSYREDKRRGGSFRGRGNGNFFDGGPPPPPPGEHFDGGFGFRGRGGNARGFRGMRRSGIRGPPRGSPRGFSHGGVGRGNFRSGYRGGY